jgi:hypothetical protein
MPDTSFTPNSNQSGPGPHSLSGESLAKTPASTRLSAINNIQVIIDRAHSENRQLTESERTEIRRYLNQLDGSVKLLRAVIQVLYENKSSIRAVGD